MKKIIITLGLVVGGALSMTFAAQGQITTFSIESIGGSTGGCPPAISTGYIIPLLAAIGWSIYVLIRFIRARKSVSFRSIPTLMVMLGTMVILGISILLWSTANDRTLNRIYPITLGIPTAHASEGCTADIVGKYPVSWLVYVALATAYLFGILAVETFLGTQSVVSQNAGTTKKSHALPIVAMLFLVLVHLGILLWA